MCAGRYGRRHDGLDELGAPSAPIQPIAASAATGAGAGVLVGALIGLGVPDEEAAYYDEEFKKSRTIVVVQTDDRTDLAYSLLNARNSQNRYNVTPAQRAEEMARNKL